MQGELLDDFHDLSDWMPVASGLARLTISPDRGLRAPAMRLDFDFQGGGGFVVARKQLTLSLPQAYVITFDLRGAAPRNKFELKLSDPSGRNVWWFHRDAFDFPDDWHPVRIRSSEIEFAWGPAGGGTLSQMGAIELAIVAGPGGKGTVWIGDLRIEDRTYRATPSVRASSAVPGHEPERALDASATTSWRSQPGAEAQWLVDFHTEREYGGLVVHWEDGHAARSFEVQTSSDGNTWTTAYVARAAAGRRSYVYMPGTLARHLRLDLREPAGDAGFGIVHVEVKPHEFSRSIEAFFESMARDATRGSYPKYLCGEQSYWSPVGVGDGSPCALLNEEGMVEVDKGSFSIEPFLFVDDRLTTWADVAPVQELEEGYLPIPSSVWRVGDVVLRTLAFATRVGNDPVLFIRYRVENTASHPRSTRLFAVCRPFQVTPPWQAFQQLGGVSPIRELACEGNVVSVDRRTLVIALSEPCRFGAAAFAQGAIADYLRNGLLPEPKAVHDDFGYACGALAYDLVIAPASSVDVFIAIPFGKEPASLGAAESLLANVSGAVELARVRDHWKTKLGAVEIQLPPVARSHVDTFKTAAAHILINRDGPALQPGPRRYTRSWIRDGASMAAALLRLGCTDEACAFIRWYARFQAPDGKVPCCVDRGGPDWLVEHDSHGELIFTVMECFRFTGDRELLREMWPAVIKAVDYVESLRNTRLGPEFAAGERRACYGLLPESASHEGYLAHPVHAYWDDFWALRGLRDAVAIAEALGDHDQAQRIAALRDAFRETLRASIDATMSQRQIDYVPGSVEWADFDPTATANAISLLDELHGLPRPALERTFDKYLEGFRRRCRNEIDWANYTPYEVRIVGALVRLGRRDDANELAAFLLGDRRPRAWNQWPEIAWRDPRSPGHIGDVPHSWIGAEYILAFRSMLVFEREAERTLVVAAGVPAEWLDGDGIVVTSLPTYYGALSFRLRRTAATTLHFSVVGDLGAPPVTIIVKPPLPGPLAYVEVDGRPITTFDAEGASVTQCPAEVVMRSGAAAPQ